MKNKLIDLNDHLFATLERLSNESLTVEQLAAEITRAKTVGGIASVIVSNARLALDAQVAVNDGLLKSAPKMLGVAVYEEAKS